MSYNITELKLWQELYLYNIFLILCKILFLLFLVLTLHEKQHFRGNAQRKYNTFLVFHNWRKYNIFSKTKTKENIKFSIIYDILRKKSVEQDNCEKLIRGLSGVSQG